MSWLKNATPPVFAGLLRAYLLLAPVARAVNPPPDGAYPNFATAEGQNALQNLTSGTGNSGLGALTLFTDSTGSFNTAVGAGALLFNNSDSNTAMGAEALLSNTNGAANTATGLGALFCNAIGDSNTASGIFALFGNTTGVNNTAIGDGALQSNITGNDNIALGESAGGLLTTGDNKKDIAALEKTSEVILSLRPVTFHYKSDVKATPQFGLIAEEVAKVNPSLVVPDKEGKPFTVRYDAINAMLLNEFLKEHRTVQEQQREIDALKAELKEQRALIQRVNDNVQLDKAAPQTVLNNR